MANAGKQDKGNIGIKARNQLIRLIANKAVSC